MSIFKCKMCGGTIEFNEGDTIGVCDSCGTKQTLPRLDSDRKANLYDRANHFRRNNEFDKAMSIYENILNEDPTDAEAYWSLVLCRYGIEYVEDPASHKRVPTVNRTQFTSIFDDENYKSALKHADGYQRVIYEEEANAINDIQKGILAISQKEKPFDVFICYKETDANGRRTQDSVLANDLYHQLTNEGFKVFFSRITLEDKLGTAYEPYIFAALNSAKVMVVLGTKPEYFNAVWVKNEWSRYLSLVKKSNGKKVLIPAYRDMDPYDLPEEFSHLQAQDMSKLGFMQDLIRGIKKIVKADEPITAARETIVAGGNTNVAPLLRRAFMFLEDGNWKEADEYCERVLDQDPENAKAYLGKLMADLKVSQRDDLKNCDQPFDTNRYYLKAIRFSDETLSEFLKGSIAHIIDRNENIRLTSIYNDACQRMTYAKTEETFKAVAGIFKSISGFKDADALAEQCLDRIYNAALNAMNYANTESRYKDISETFKLIPGYKDADLLAQQCIERAETCRKDEIYNNSVKRLSAATKTGEYKAALELFKRIPGFKDADALAEQCLDHIYNAALSAINQASTEAHYKDISETFKLIPGYKDADYLSAQCLERAEICRKEWLYSEALSNMNGGRVVDYESAIRYFREIPDWKDSQEQITICQKRINEKIEEAKRLELERQEEERLEREKKAEQERIEKEKAAKKRRMMKAIVTSIIIVCFALFFLLAKVITKQKYNAKVAKYGQEFVDSFHALNVGDVYKFGSYEQDNNTANGTEDIEWVVLAKEKGGNRNRILVISKDALDCQQFNIPHYIVTWETCSLRKWLNETFLNAAFSESERAMIPSVTVSADKNPEYSRSPGNSTMDQVFLLSITEANKYFSSAEERKCAPTDYAIAQGAYQSEYDSVDGRKACSWWLRSTGYLSDDAADVSSSGYVSTVGDGIHNYHAVRPALWIDLGS